MEDVKPKEINVKRKENFEESLVIEDLRNALRRINSSVKPSNSDLDFIVVSS